jgi:hypothetical protein
VGVDVDEIVFATLPDQRTLKNLRRDPPIALSAPTTTLNQWALLEYLVVYGTSRVTEGGVAESPPTSSALASENPSKPDPLARQDAFGAALGNQTPDLRITRALEC